MLTIIDYGVGNLASVQNMLKKAGAESVISTDVRVISKASKIILPGVGAFDHCMNMFNNSGLRQTVTKKALEEKVPVLGICVGLQMLMESSEEGIEKGLGWVPGKVVKFDINKMPEGYKIPHMGWTDIQPEAFCKLYEGIDEPRFYFVHSYHVFCEDNKNITSTAVYGYPFTASVQKENIMGVQFHPEKSHKFGMQLYKNFINFF
jgi:imidazole glycerol-phosphate synthase subunit HisH